MDTIKKSADFRQVSRSPVKWIAKPFIIQLLKREDMLPFRLGLVVTKKTGCAVTRNRIKRRFRAIMRDFALNHQNSLKGYDVVLIGRSAAEEYDFSQMQKDLLWCLKKLEMEI